MIHIEKAILSNIFLSKETRVEAFEKLNEIHFSGPYKTIFSICKKLYQQCGNIDPVIVLKEAGEAYTDVVMDLANFIGISSSMKEYIKIVYDNYAKHQALVMTKNLLQKIEKENMPIEKIQKEYLEISKLFNSENSKFKTTSIQDGLLQLFNSLEKGEVRYYKTGYKKLDKCIPIDKGDMIVIGGRPSSGKTTLSTNMMINMSKEHKVVFFSLETSAEQIYKKIIAAKALIGINQILYGTLKKEDYERFLDVTNELYNNKFVIVEAAGMTVDDIRAKALQEKADIIFIDYLQLVKDRANSVYERVTNISIDLHTMAQKDKITVFALSQLKRKSDGKEPEMSDLRESGQIEQDADAVLLIHTQMDCNDVEDPQRRDILIAKNKKGQLGCIRFKFYGNTQLFDEV